MKRIRLWIARIARWFAPKITDVTTCPKLTNTSSTWFLEVEE